MIKILQQSLIRQKGIVLIITFLTMGVLMLLGVYFLSFTLTESKISASQKTAIQAYYLAEAGINEAIWKLKNDSEWQSKFETEPDWSDNFSRSDVLFEGGSYQIQIQNFGCAIGEIIATSTLSLPNEKSAQRKVETGVFKTIGGLIENMAVFSGGGGGKDELKIKGSEIKIYYGNLFSNDEIKIEKQSHVTVADNSETEELEGQILAVKEFKLKDSNVTATEIHAENYPPAPDLIFMPKLDFDSKDENSYKSQAEAAGAIYTQKEFEDLLWEVGEGGTLTLDNDITYIKGAVRLRGNRSLVVNGLLVAEKNIEIGKKKDWKREDETHQGNNQLTVNNSDPAGKPSGLLTKRKIEFGKYTSAAVITGLLYANDEMKFKKMSDTFTLEGGIIAKKIKFEDMNDVNISLNNTIIIITLGYAEFSPVINIDHWEEDY